MTDFHFQWQPRLEIRLSGALTVTAVLYPCVKLPDSKISLAPHGVQEQKKLIGQDIVLEPVSHA